MGKGEKEKRNNVGLRSLELMMDRQMAGLWKETTYDKHKHEDKRVDVGNKVGEDGRVVRRAFFLSGENGLSEVFKRNWIRRMIYLRRKRMDERRAGVEGRKARKTSKSGG